MKSLVNIICTSFKVSYHNQCSIFLLFTLGLNNMLLDSFCMKNGIIPHPQSTHYYIKCWDKRVEECKKCPGNMFFNKDCGACAPELCGNFLFYRLFEFLRSYLIRSYFYLLIRKILIKILYYG